MTAVVVLILSRLPVQPSTASATTCSVSALIAPLLDPSLLDTSDRSTTILWAHLSPQVRQSWVDQHDMAAFLSAKFRGLPPFRIAHIAVAPGGSLVQFRLAGPTSAVNAGDLKLLLAFPLSILQPISGPCMISDLGPFDASAPVLRRATPLRQHAAIPILMYHYISAQPTLTALQYGLTVTDGNFSAQLSYLSDHGYHTILLPRLYAYLDDNAPLPAHPVVLTFDDGYADNYTDAIPILQRHHMVGEFGVITAFVGQQVGINTYMSWPQLAALRRAGMEIESHSVDHQDLRYVTAGVMRNEVRYSQATLRQQLDVPAQFFTYPSGEPFRSGTAVQQNAIVGYLQEYGVVGALLDPVTPSIQQDGSQPYQLQRVRVSGGEDLATFIARLHGSSQ